MQRIRAITALVLGAALSGCASTPDELRGGYTGPEPAAATEDDIGTAVRHIGGSSFHLGHAIFANGECKATATSVIVQVQGRPLRSVPLTEDQKALVRRIGEID